MAISQESMGIIYGASSGVGNATLSRLSPLVKKIYALSRHESRVQGNVNNVTSIQCDIRNYNEVDHVIKRIAESGTVDFVINCVGVAFYAPINHNYAKYWEDIYLTNVVGLLNIISTTYQYLKSNQHFIHIGSLASHRVSNTPGNIVYSSSKLAATPLLNHFRSQLREQKIGMKVTTISPGYIENTQFSERYFQSNREATTNLFGQFKSLHAEDVAKIIVDILSMENHIEINDILIRPREQPD